MFRSSRPEVFCKKMFLEVLQNSQVRCNIIVHINDLQSDLRYWCAAPVVQQLWHFLTTHFHPQSRETSNEKCLRDVVSRVINVQNLFFHCLIPCQVTKTCSKLAKESKKTLFNLWINFFFCSFRGFVCWNDKKKYAAWRESGRLKTYAWNRRTINFEKLNLFCVKKIFIFLSLFSGCNSDDNLSAD